MFVNWYSLIMPFKDRIFLPNKYKTYNPVTPYVPFLIFSQLYPVCER